MNRPLSRAASLAAVFAAATTGCSPGGADATAAQKGGGDSALQTTIADAPPEGAASINVETLAEGLVNPWSLAFLPEGGLLVTEREGRLRIIRGGRLVEAPVAGVPQVYAANQAGLFDILLDPDFAENSILYLSYAHGTARENATRVARATYANDQLTNVEVIYEAKPLKDTSLHYGGRMAIGGDGKLYLTVGEGSRYKERAQVMSTSFGAVVRLNRDGTVPDDNADFDDGLPELWTKGHRNPQGLAWDAERGVMWEHEHGAQGGDEINIIEKGANYGWPLATYGVDYSGARISPFTEYVGTNQPFKYWTPSIAPSGLAVYRGDVFADWDGDLLVGAMKAGSEALHRIDLDDAGRELGEERYLIGERIRDVRVGPEGAIYVTTEDRGGAPVGKVLRLTLQR